MINKKCKESSLLIKKIGKKYQDDQLIRINQEFKVYETEIKLYFPNIETLIFEDIIEPNCCNFFNQYSKIELKKIEIEYDEDDFEEEEEEEEFDDENEEEEEENEEENVNNKMEEDE